MHYLSDWEGSCTLKSSSLEHVNHGSKIPMSETNISEAPGFSQVTILAICSTVMENLNQKILAMGISLHRSRLLFFWLINEP